MSCSSGILHQSSLLLATHDFAPPGRSSHLRLVLVKPPTTRHRSLPSYITPASAITYIRLGPATSIGSMLFLVLHLTPPPPHLPVPVVPGSSAPVLCHLSSSIRLLLFLLLSSCPSASCHTALLCFCLLSAFQIPAAVHLSMPSMLSVFAVLPAHGSASAFPHQPASTPSHCRFWLAGFISSLPPSSTHLCPPAWASALPWSFFCSPARSAFVNISCPLCSVIILVLNLLIISIPISLLVPFSCLHPAWTVFSACSACSASPSSRVLPTVPSSLSFPPCASPRRHPVSHLAVCLSSSSVCRRHLLHLLHPCAIFCALACPISSCLCRRLPSPVL